MQLEPLQILVVVAAIANAVLAGVYLAFSVMVMPALRRRPDREAVAAMQEVNRQAVRPPFMLVLLGAPVLAVVVVVLVVIDTAATGLDAPGATLLAGAAVAVAGFVGTVALNVPINSAVERLGPQPSKVALEAWPQLAARWTAANTLRGALCALAALLLLVG